MSLTWKQRVHNAILCGGFTRHEKCISFDHFRGPALEKLARVRNIKNIDKDTLINKISPRAFELTCQFSEAVFNDDPEKAKILLSKINRMNITKFLRESDI